MNSPEHQKYLDGLAADFFKKLSKKELCRRIAEAVTQQDSCGRCEADNIKARLYTGQDGYLTCASCTKEIIAIDGATPSEGREMSELDLGELEFTAEDFFGDCNHDGLPRSFSILAAACANRMLREKLAKAQYMQIEQNVQVVKMAELIETLRAENDQLREALDEWLYLFDHRAMMGSRLEIVVEKARAALAKGEGK